MKLIFKKFEIDYCSWHFLEFLIFTAWEKPYLKPYNAYSDHDYFENVYHLNLCIEDVSIYIAGFVVTKVN